MSILAGKSRLIAKGLKLNSAIDSDRYEVRERMELPTASSSRHRRFGGPSILAGCLNVSSASGRNNQGFDWFVALR